MLPQRKSSFFIVTSIVYDPNTLEILIIRVHSPWIKKNSDFDWNTLSQLNIIDCHLGHVRVELDSTMDSLYRLQLRRRKPLFARNVRRELVRHGPRLEERRRVADRRRLGQGDVVVLGQDGLNVRVRLHLEQRLDQVLVDVEDAEDRGDLLGQVAEHLDGLLELAQLAGAHGQPTFQVDHDVRVAAWDEKTEQKIVTCF